MRKIKCCECGKQYDYDEDGFCPKCGAFNQPPRSARIGANGELVRVDGLNEQGHAGSFAHREFHEEERERRRIGLDKSVQRIQRAGASALKPERVPISRRPGKKTTWKPGVFILKTIGVFLLLNMVLGFIARLIL